MQCPIDGSNLQMMERQGIEIDYCPQCRGVWLDRGELDKIIERSRTVFGGGQQPETARVADMPGAPTMPVHPQMAPQVPPQPPGAPYAPPPAPGQPYPYPRDYDRDDDDYPDRGGYPQARGEYRDYDREYGRKRKRRSFLDDIFDFD
ncbi:MAG: zf-TFIIB domain-containing protein [Chloroflexota bacterium]|nr:zf-TFIIB domain-containing protein [Chloroflexota bacterium]MDQ5866585.1 zf-TFIIB domain-containing protein [Chloroflexota bacterium]